MLSRQPEYSKQSAKIDFGAAVSLPPSLAPKRNTNESEIIIIFVWAIYFWSSRELMSIECATNRKRSSAANEHKRTLALAAALLKNSCKFSGEFDQDDTRHIYYGIFHNKFFFLPNFVVFCFLFYCCRYCTSVATGHRPDKCREKRREKKTIPFGWNALRRA